VALVTLIVLEEVSHVADSDAQDDGGQQTHDSHDYPPNDSEDKSCFACNVPITKRLKVISILRDGHHDDHQK